MSPLADPMTERARSASMRQYAKAHDEWSEREQVYMGAGREIEAAGARVYAEIAVRAWCAERDDRDPGYEKGQA